MYKRFCASKIPPPPPPPPSPMQVDKIRSVEELRNFTQVLRAALEAPECVNNPQKIYERYVATRVLTTPSVSDKIYTFTANERNWYLGHILGSYAFVDASQMVITEYGECITLFRALGEYMKRVVQNFDDINEKLAQCSI